MTDPLNLRDRIFRLIRALDEADFDIKAASPLQHWASCGFWANPSRACSCPIRAVVSAIDALRKEVK
jgi:hypothetical protein